MIEGIIDKKYLRVPDFIFQIPPPNYITAVGRNALGLNKKKLTFDDIKNLKEKSKQRKQELKKNKLQKEDNIEEEEETEESKSLNIIESKRKKLNETTNESIPEQPNTKKQKIEISEFDWLNIPEAKKMTKNLTPDITDGKNFIINKYNSLDKSIAQGDDDLLLFNNFDWKEQIKETVKTSHNYEKILYKSFKKTLKDPISDNLIFHLDLLQESVPFMKENKYSFVNQVDSILRYTSDDNLWRKSYKLLVTLGIKPNEKTIFLNNFLAKKDKVDYKKFGWAIHELYLLSVAEQEDVEQDYISKKKTLSKFINKYGDNIIELLYESCILESDDEKKTKELISLMPLISWETYFNKVYSNEDKSIDKLLIYVIDIMVNKRYNKGNLHNLQNLMKKFDNNNIRQYILEKIMFIDNSTNIWEYYFNNELRDKTKNVKTISDFFNKVIINNKKESNSFDDVLKLFLRKFYYFNILKTKEDIDTIHECLEKNQHYSEAFLLERLKLKRQECNFNNNELSEFFKGKDQKNSFFNFEYECEFINWKIALKDHPDNIIKLFENVLIENNHNQKLYYMYCNYLISIESTEKLLTILKEALDKFPYDPKFIDYLFSISNKEILLVECTKLKAKYNKMIDEIKSNQAEILFLLQKLLYKEIALDINDPLNIKKINKYLQKYKISNECIKANPEFGLIISLKLKIEFQKGNANNNNSIIKALISNYLSQYDNNFLVMYQIGILLKDCKWLLNSIKKNNIFANPYNELLDKNESIKHYKNFDQIKRIVLDQSLYQLYLPELEFEEFNKN
ncbi:hypothetical protein HANVADRAFT_52237 [Hanseniaspora valbyensis NRRL Y-1626]|uniref:Uncharacterized protein n=1 Tax=Hanseniaspora valbyensis NRRL Y-1626 TaxID=766949 RepID=A0A1B7TFG9_9ASCO|nr:hypothetical protein HANVADRAFT_52237 [Hanseniaspora valbyensis NRRL Y-1626]